MFKKILEDWICNYDYYKKIIDQSILEKEEQKQELQKIIDEQNTKRKAAEKALKKALTKEEPFNILDTKEWYYERFSRQPKWYYNAYSNGLREVSTIISAGEQKIVKDLANEYITTYKLKKGVTPEEVIETIARHFMKRNNWRYTTDINLYGVPEYWAPAAESIKKGFRGDCDALAILMHNLIYYIFKELGLKQHYWRLKFTAHGTMVEAHAFNIWLGEDGEWYVLESTLDLAGSFNKTWLKTPMRNNNLYTGNPWGFADRDNSWRGLISSLQPYNNNG